jgi:hypothetical protein
MNAGLAKPIPYFLVYSKAEDRWRGDHTKMTALKAFAINFVVGRDWNSSAYCGAQLQPCSAIVSPLLDPQG